MRKYRVQTTILLISILFLNGCSVLDKYELTSNSIDLTKFEKQGIFVTTGDLSQKYKSVSILIANCYDGFTPKADLEDNTESIPTKKQSYDDIYADDSNTAENTKNFNFKPCTLDDLFAEIISQAKNKGANGIIKLEIRNVTKPGISGKTTQKGLEIVGLAIKIEE